VKVYCVLSRTREYTLVKGVFASIKLAKAAWPFDWQPFEFKANDKFRGRTILHARGQATNSSQWAVEEWYVSEFEIQGVQDPVADLAMLALGGDPMAIDLIKDAISLNYR
jgi:hypothetical protein